MRLSELIESARKEDIEAFHEQIGKNVRRLRKKHNMSQLELAVLIGHRSPAFLANAENNARNQHFNLEHLFKIATALEVSMNDFFIEPKNEAQDLLEDAGDAKELPSANNHGEEEVLNPQEKLPEG